MFSKFKKRRLQGFTWAVGVEDTFIPQSRPDLRPLDEYELTQHYQQWREDLKRAASLGVKKIRWGVPWYLVEAKPGEYNWSWVDEVLQFIHQLNLDPIVDLVHYGTPLWMDESFIDARYVASVTAFEAAFAERYAGLVKYYTPLNEPTVNAEFSGRNGQWPPYLKGETGYVRVLLQIARGMQSSMHAIRQRDPNASLVAVEAMHHYRPMSKEAESAAQQAFLKDVLCWDLVEGRVNKQHGLYNWLLDNGASAEELKQLLQKPARFDIFGANFYPWSAFHVSVEDGKARLDPAFGDGRLLADVLRDCSAHTQLPLFITETSAVGYRRQSWLKETTDAVNLAIDDGLPVIGYTWFPLFSMIEWDYRTTKDAIDNHLLHLGLWDIRIENGVMKREEAPVAQSFRDVVKDSQKENLTAKIWRNVKSLLANVFKTGK